MLRFLLISSWFKAVNSFSHTKYLNTQILTDSLHVVDVDLCLNLLLLHELLFHQGGALHRRNWLKSFSVLIFKKIFFRQKPEGLRVQWCLTLCALDRTCYWRGGEGIRMRIKVKYMHVPSQCYNWAISGPPEGTCSRHWRGFREGSHWGGPLVQPPSWTKKKINFEIKQKDKYIDVYFFVHPCWLAPFCSLALPCRNSAPRFSTP